MLPCETDIFKRNVAFPTMLKFRRKLQFICEFEPQKKNSLTRLFVEFGDIVRFMVLFSEVVDVGSTFESHVVALVILLAVPPKDMFLVSIRKLSQYMFAVVVFAAEMNVGEVQFTINVVLSYSLTESSSPV